VRQAAGGSPYVGRKGFAMLLNSTTTSYHWGCYATSMMLFDGITRQGFAVTSVPVEVIHSGLVYPEKAEEPTATNIWRNSNASTRSCCRLSPTATWCW
jgi:hypothetical protein